MIQDSGFKNKRKNNMAFEFPGADSAHHAYAVSGVAVDLLETLRSDWKIQINGNPDFHYHKFNSCGIGEARNIKEAQEKKSIVDGGKKIFVIEAEAITSEAQNSLLKMFEEPTADTYFFLAGNCVRNLLPTLQSRLTKINIGKVSPSSTTRGEALEFLASGQAKRLAFAKDLADDIRDDKKSKSDAMKFIQEIEDVIYQKSKKDRVLPPKALEAVEKCRDYMADRSASVKMLLEFLAVTLPKIG